MQPHVIEKLLTDEERHEAFVFCDGQKHRITIADVSIFGFAEGMTLSEEQFTRLLEAEERLACIQKAFSFLSYGDLSKRKLTEKLRRSFSKERSEEIAELMEERGYLNDLQLAKRYAENYYELRSYGPGRIKQELYGKGFSLPVIEDALEEYRQMDHSEKIKDLLLQKFSLETLSDPAMQRKASAWLSRQGYDWAAVSAVFYELF